MRPSWCQQFYLLLREALPLHHCSVLVYGNERGFSPDVLVTDAARILNIPTAAELLNLFVDKDVVPTVLVAPSTYAVEHETIQAVLNIPTHDAQRHPLAVQRPFAVVIPPSVDFVAFHPERFAENRAQNPVVYQHPACKAVGYVYAVSDGPSAPCTVIAFIARLAPGENYYSTFLFFILFIQLLLYSRCFAVYRKECWIVPASGVPYIARQSTRALHHRR